ncbi:MULTISPECIES: response regulator transcription factor [unclassified Streptomyces]|uniref:Response regulator transcription factor n=1 Tax=Streptomyces sp. NBC_00180 TaxID=2903632 RepID=A0AAU1ICJ4_9ACTN|nr:response regulator transcription factor [Streptomyces sp. NBC_01017]WSV34880.1 response regulator transcription factor [Streptomyces sp. NBC_01017]
MPRVLVVEDDPRIRVSLIEILTEQGHTVRSTGSGFEALREVAQDPFDAVVLDLGLPDLDGGDVLQMMRGISSVPVMVVTARDDEAEIIRLLNAGADDYVVKPFSGGQLVARLSAVLRRTAGAASSSAHHTDGAWRPPAVDLMQPVSVGDLTVDPPARTVLLADRELRLTRREFDLLSFLAHHAGQVISKQQLLNEVWREPYVDDQTVDVHLSALRRKLGERASAPRYLQTVRGVGIKLMAPR